jgi:ATP-dependent Clp protease protease subunit
VNTYVDGYCASAATLLSVVGKNRYMSANSLILIHQLYSGYEGKYEELSDSMINTNNLMKKIKNIYLKHTNIKENELNEILKHDLWLDAETSLKYGLVDKIII